MSHGGLKSGGFLRLFVSGSSIIVSFGNLFGLFSSLQVILKFLCRLVARGISATKSLLQFVSFLGQPCQFFHLSSKNLLFACFIELFELLLAKHSLHSRVGQRLIQNALCL